MKKSLITKRLILYELIGFGVMIFFLFADEIFDIPHHVFGAPATPINWLESVIEGAFAAILCAFVVLWTWRLVNKVKYLEGFLPVCSFCKKIRVNKDWVPIEAYIRSHSAAEFSHGLCPECMKKNYGELFEEDKKP